MGLKFAVIKERKSPSDRRVVLTPKACKTLLDSHSEAAVLIEPSEIRAFSDAEYKTLGLKVKSDIGTADVMIGVKEVPIEALIPNKSYFFFSHTIKKQPYNRELLQAVLAKNITLYDHETLVNEKYERLIGFGYYAGLVGAYNAMRTIGKKFNCFTLPKANELKDRYVLESALKRIK